MAVDVALRKWPVVHVVEHAGVHLHVSYAGIWYAADMVWSVVRVSA